MIQITKDDIKQLGSLSSSVKNIEKMLCEHNKEHSTITTDISVLKRFKWEVIGGCIVTATIGIYAVNGFLGDYMKPVTTQIQDIDDRVSDIESILNNL